MTKQIAVKLPDDLVGALDRLVDEGSFASRSQAVRTGLETVIAGRRRDELDRRYLDAAIRLPETPDEMADATRLALDAIHDEPWERWW